MARTSIEQLVRNLRIEAARAKRVRKQAVGSPAYYDATTVTITMPRHVALMAADYLEMTFDRRMATARMESAIREAGEIAEENLKDIVLRFSYATTDLEILLQEFVGRPLMTMQEVREQRQIAEARPSPGPQPFHRKPQRQPFKASDELARSIRQGRIGNPREPGEDG